MDLPLSSLERFQYNRFNEDYRQIHSRSVNYIHVTLHKALKQAVIDGLVPRNVADAVKVPKVYKKEVKPLTTNQVKTLLSAASGYR